MMRHVLMTSGGACSYFSGKVLARRLGRPPDMLFADTLIEDGDTYRLLVQGSCDILGLPLSRFHGLEGWWEELPSLDEMEQRKLWLKDFRDVAMQLLPGLHWLQDGRHPWEVFKDERFIGNTRAGICSRVLKQETCRKWLEQNCDPQDTTIHLGIHWSEMDRLTGTPKKKGARELWAPWRCEAPLCEEPFLPAEGMFEEMKEAGIKVPVLYEQGQAHSNCGAFCVEGGQKHFAKLLQLYPDRYLWHERQEEEMRLSLAKDVSILRDRRDGRLKPLTMRRLRDRLEQGAAAACDDGNACGCFVSSEDDRADP
jgi:hypothetical protein